MLFHVVMLEIATDDPVEPAIIRLLGDHPDFLRELLDIFTFANRRPEQQRQGNTVAVAGPDAGLVILAERLAAAIAGDAGKRTDTLELVREVERQTPGFAVELLGSRVRVALVGLPVRQTFSDRESFRTQGSHLCPRRAPRAGSGGRTIYSHRMCSG